MMWPFTKQEPTKRQTYAFRPKPDITAFELAETLRCIQTPIIHHGYDFLEENLKRHWFSITEE